MTYEEFESTAADLFGLEPWEAAELAEQLTASGVDLDVRSTNDFWADVAESDALGDVLAAPDEYEDESPYELDPYFPDDDWLDAGVEWEMTAETPDGYSED